MIPLQTQILDIIDARLKLIKESNGYFNTIIKVERGRLKPFQNGDMPAINYYSTNDALEKNLNTSISDRILSVVIECYTLTRDRIFSDLSDELASDIIIALERDPSTPTIEDNPSVRLGKAVSKVEVQSITPAIGEGQTPYCGTVINLNIVYRVDRQTPFTLINI